MPHDHRSRRSSRVALGCRVRGHVPLSEGRVMTGWSRVLLLLLVAMTATAVPVRAQETPAPPNSASARFLPDVADFGDGWSLARTAALELDTDVFREGAVGSFVGPDGSRVVAAAMLVTQERVAVRRSWEAAMSL